MRVALVVMPWFGVEMPALGVATLKPCLERQGYRTDVFNLNLNMAERVGVLAHELAGQARRLWPEWFFAYHVFGPGGLGLLEERLDDVLAVPSFRDFLERSGLTEKRAAELLERDVPAFLDECLESVPWGSYDVIGFSSIMASHLGCLALARRLKERHPDKIVVFGGSNVEGEMGREALKACGWIDYVVSGEGEKAFLGLLDSLREGRSGAGLPGVIARRAGAAVQGPAIPAMDLDELPAPDHSDYFETLKSSPAREWIRTRVTFEASRGCWWGAKQHCTFCGLNGAIMAMRVKDPGLVLRDILELSRRYGCVDFHSTDNILALEHFQRLLPELRKLRLEQGMDFSFLFEVKSNLTEAQIQLLADAGVNMLQPGIESLDSSVLKLMRKGVRAIQNIQTLKFATERGLEVPWYILYGFPGEDPKVYGPMAELCQALSHLFPPIAAAHIEPDRYSPYHDNPGGFGIEKPRPHSTYRFLYPTPRFDLDRAAYFFEFAGRPQGGAPPAYAQGVVRATEQWKRAWGRTFFAYRQGAEGVELFDCRASRPGAAQEFTRTRLEGFEALAFRLFRSAAPLSRLEAAARESGAWPGETAARARLESLVARRVLFREGDQYLSLATPVGVLGAHQRLAFERMTTVAREMILQSQAGKGLRLTAQPAESARG